MLLLSDKLMNCCAEGTDGCLDLRRRAFAFDGQVSAEWSGCPGFMARRAEDSVASLRRNSGTGRGHAITIRKASLMAGLVGRV